MLNAVVLLMLVAVWLYGTVSLLSDRRYVWALIGAVLPFIGLAVGLYRLVELNLPRK